MRFWQVLVTLGCVPLFLWNAINNFDLRYDGGGCGATRGMSLSIRLRTRRVVV